MISDGPWRPRRLDQTPIHPMAYPILGNRRHGFRALHRPPQLLLRCHRYLRTQQCPFRPQPCPTSLLRSQWVFVLVHPPHDPCTRPSRQRGIPRSHEPATITHQGRAPRGRPPLPASVARHFPHWIHRAILRWTLRSSTALMPRVGLLVSNIILTTSCFLTISVFTVWLCFFHHRLQIGFFLIELIICSSLGLNFWKMYVAVLIPTILSTTSSSLPSSRRRGRWLITIVSSRVWLIIFMAYQSPPYCRFI